MGIRWKDRVEDVLDPTIAHDERQTFDQRMPGDDVSRKGESARQLKINITQKREGQTQPLDNFKLGPHRLRREPGHGRARIPKVCCMVAEAARLRRAAAGTGNEIPVGRERRLSRPSSAGESVKKEPISAPSGTRSTRNFPLLRSKAGQGRASASPQGGKQRRRLRVPAGPQAAQSGR
jgi:hypothetical protein